MKRALKFVEHHGWRELFRRLRIASVGRLYDRRTVHVAVLRLSLVSKPITIEGMRELQAADLGLMSRTMYQSGHQILARFERGDRCFAVIEDGSIASYMWVAGKTHHLSEAYSSFRCDGDQAWLYNAVTVRSARGRGYYTQLFQYILAALSEQGMRRLYGYAEEDNFPSRAGMRKAGFEPVACLNVTKFLGSRRLHVRILGAEAWGELRANLSNPPENDRFMELMESPSTP
jgi:RimJ/RimL family protein N-acetyltransferase